MCNSDVNLCPVCGYRGLTESHWIGGSASDEICPCCGTHFGYDDAAGGDPVQRKQRHIHLREAWKASGCPWFSSRPAPHGWDAETQLEVLQNEV